MEINKAEILDIINGNVDSYVMIIKAKYKDFYDYIINNMAGTKFSEKLYNWVNFDIRDSIGKCKNCSGTTKFLTFPLGYREFCSTKCANIFSSDVRSEKMTKTEKDLKYWVEKNCEVCGLKFWSLIKRNGRFCSNQCSTKFTANSADRIAKIKKTKLERYGNEIYVNSEKAKITCLEKYGVNNASKSELVKEKLKELGTSRFLKNLDKHKLNKASVPLFTDSEYKSTYKDNKYKFQCKTCKAIFYDHIDGGHLPRCLKCNPYIQGFSIGEKELVEYVKTLLVNDEVIEKDRTVLIDRELDIYIPSKKLAIEFNGLYWHGEVGGKKDRKYHLEKLNRCNALGIRLLHIFEDEWLYKKDLLKNKLKHILGLSDDGNRIYARKCEIREISVEESRDFLENTHIQGYINSIKICIGLFYKLELVSVMAFGYPRIALGGKNVDGNIYEVYRYSTNKTVIGGAGKLLNFFISNYNPNKIISYADKRYSNGGLYEKIGFVKVSDGIPNYWYFKPGNFTRYHRFSFRKDQLSKKLEIFDESLSEWENMQLNGYDRIWDCGNLKYEWNVKI